MIKFEELTSRVLCLNAVIRIVVRALAFYANGPGFDPARGES